MNTELNVTTPADDYFRSHLPNQNENGGRQWLYPRATSGRFTKWRTVVAVGLLVALFVGPFIWVDGHPLFLFNVLERRFIFFGVTFWPQDFYLVAIGLITFIVFITLFTVVFGRVFCGWACPQTIFMEMVFRKVETWIEGDYNARKRLDAAPWTTEKILKKTAKHGAFFLVSFAISNTFLVYIIGRDQWSTLITDNPAQHLAGLTTILVFTGVFYGVFAYLREIVCTTICPYGRLQSVLLDKNSLIVAYDYIRGEPRGKRVKNEELKVKNNSTTLHSSLLTHHLPKGDCVDCKLCVHVCPTGIDIRNGTQMECINCTACMDACDEVMSKIDRPSGLIRMDSQQGIDTRKPFRFTKRIMAYSGVLVLLLGVLGFLLISRPALDVTILRAPGQLFQREANGQVANLYSVELINKTYRALPVRFRLNRPDATLRFVQPLSQTQPGELTQTMFFITLPEKAIHADKTRLTIDVLTGDTVVDQVETSFLGPISMGERMKE
ncbi:cytochrome c oxidase accessory protein CcoG [Spirosoma endophyticum]|uniref:Cytochrome c oxidase accessory protein FixG n=1 Tax=Spirosoma endophyticum TaxID=662367 RepID=A0A1I1HK93_9BACT|nr:cytochrome c oxidase accessory protein CcoG [Spirosoma endophyticum]SFC24497.1 cytochrome c oxidase accessory protein FixG [Spirosoma endophyticum]